MQGTSIAEIERAIMDREETSRFIRDEVERLRRIGRRHATWLHAERVAAEVAAVRLDAEERNAFRTRNPEWPQTRDASMRAWARSAECARVLREAEGHIHEVDRTFWGLGQLLGSWLFWSCA